MKRLTFRALALRQSNLQYSPTDTTPQFLCGISHTLSRPAKFISLFIYLSTREKCLPRGFYLAFSEPRRLDSNSCFFTVDCAAAISVLSCWVLENLYGISFLFPGDFCFQGEDKSFSIFTGSLRALTFQFRCESFTVKLSRKAITFVYLVCVLSFIIRGVCFVIFSGVYNIRFFSRKPTKRTKRGLCSVQAAQELLRFHNPTFIGLDLRCGLCRIERSHCTLASQHLSAWIYLCGLHFKESQSVATCLTSVSKCHKLKETIVCLELSRVLFMLINWVSY